MRTSLDIGKGFEKTLEGVFSSLQKTHAFKVHKMVDSHAAGNMVAGQPADYLIRTHNQTAWLEAKTSSKNKRMTRSALQPSQKGAIKYYSQILGMPYFIVYFAEVENSVQLLNGSLLMKGTKPDHTECTILDFRGDHLRQLLIKGLDLQPLPPYLQTFQLNFGA